MIRAEIVRNRRAIDVLAEDWATLDAIGLCEPSTSLEWARALLVTHVRESDVLFAVVMRSADRVVAMVPAIIRSERFAGMLDVACVYPLCELTPTHSDILRVSDRLDIVPAFFEAIAALPLRWDVLRIGRLLEAGTIGQQLTEYLPRSGLRHRIRSEDSCFVLELGPTYEQFLTARSAKFRNYLRRKTRQLEAAGRVKVLVAGRDVSVSSAYDDLLSIEERSWKHSHGTAISAVPRQQTFYRLLCDGAASTGRLHLMLMYLNDIPIAFNLGIKVADRYSYLKTSFDERLRHLSPATVLRARLVEALILAGVRLLDFPAEPYQWEKQWTNDMRSRRSVLVFNRTPRAMQYRLLVRLRDLLRRSSDGVQYADPRALRAP